MAPPYPELVPKTEAIQGVSHKIRQNSRGILRRNTPCSNYDMAELMTGPSASTRKVHTTFRVDALYIRI